MQFDQEHKRADELTARVMEELIKRAPKLIEQVLKETGIERELAGE